MLCFVTGGLALLVYISMIIIVPKGSEMGAEPHVGGGAPKEERGEGQEPNLGEGDFEMRSPGG